MIISENSRYSPETSGEEALEEGGLVVVVVVVGSREAEKKNPMFNKVLPLVDLQSFLLCPSLSFPLVGGRTVLNFTTLSFSEPWGGG